MTTYECARMHAFRPEVRGCSASVILLAVGLDPRVCVRSSAIPVFCSLGNCQTYVRANSSRGNCCSPYKRKVSKPTHPSTHPPRHSPGLPPTHPSTTHPRPHPHTHPPTHPRTHPPTNAPTRGSHGESLVPPHTRGRVSLSPVNVNLWLTSYPEQSSQDRSKPLWIRRGVIWSRSAKPPHRICTDSRHRSNYVCRPGTRALLTRRLPRYSPASYPTTLPPPPPPPPPPSDV